MYWDKETGFSMATGDAERKAGKPGAAFRVADAIPKRQEMARQAAGPSPVQSSASGPVFFKTTFQIRRLIESGYRGPMVLAQEDML